MGLERKPELPANEMTESPSFISSHNENRWYIKFYNFCSSSQANDQRSTPSFRSTNSRLIPHWPPPATRLPHQLPVQPHCLHCKLVNHSLILNLSNLTSIFRLILILQAKNTSAYYCQCPNKYLPGYCSFINYVWISRWK